MWLGGRNHRSILVGVFAGLLSLIAPGCGVGEESLVPTSDQVEPEDDGVDAATAAERAAGPSETATEAGTDVAADAEQLFPDVIGATAELGADGSWTVSATLSSPYDTPERYADAWRVVGPDGEVYGIRELAHDHANEQPFTRSQSGIAIPDAVTTVTVEGRDQVSGWGGATVELELVR